MEKLFTWRRQVNNWWCFYFWRGVGWGGIEMVIGSVCSRGLLRDISRRLYTKYCLYSLSALYESSCFPQWRCVVAFYRSYRIRTSTPYAGDYSGAVLARGLNVDKHYTPKQLGDSEVSSRRSISRYFVSFTLALCISLSTTCISIVESNQLWNLNNNINILNWIQYSNIVDIEADYYVLGYKTRDSNKVVDWSYTSK